MKQKIVFITGATSGFGRATARRFAEACAQQALSVRAFDGDGVRVSIDVPQANDRFLEICSNFETASRHVVS